jgi:hypothetical protein
MMAAMVGKKTLGTGPCFIWTCLAAGFDFSLTQYRAGAVAINQQGAQFMGK